MSRLPYGPDTDAWRVLSRASAELASASTQSLFAADSDRPEALLAETSGIVLDYSRQLIDRGTLGALLDLAEQTGLQSWIERMFAGARINDTEKRAVLHVALRRPADAPLLLDGEDVMPLVEQERRKIRRLADALESGELRGWTGKPIRDVVNIGIGGSDLGIVMAVQALGEDNRSGVGVHCVSNIDGVALAHLLARLDPETTAFVICSKTFTTLETLTNANHARRWLLGHGGERAIAAQCIAISTNDAAMDEFGIAPAMRLRFWDWVGGRFSLWSAVGLSIALAIGSEAFDRMLLGGHLIDSHFQSDAFERNLPVLLGLLGVWNRNFLGCTSHVVLPYDDHLSRFPAYLQQLEMESNGKSVRRNGEPVRCATCPAIWGEPGSNAQHSFMQLLHQGTDRFSVDFLLPAKSLVDRQDAQDLAAANCLAQSWALACGDPDGASADSHKSYDGNRPNSLIIFEKTDAETLGKLIALYEHKVFVQGVVWDVNSFDQWGVELGKRLASRLGTALTERRDDPRPIAGALDRLRSFRSRGSSRSA